jgi:hypothetical protein
MPATHHLLGFIAPMRRNCSRRPASREEEVSASNAQPARLGGVLLNGTAVSGACRADGHDFQHWIRLARPGYDMLRRVRRLRKTATRHPMSLAMLRAEE